MSAIVALAAGCFEAPKPQCAFQCGGAGECPEGYYCSTDDFCKRDDVPESFSCEGNAPSTDAAVLVDASDVPDGAPVPDAAPGTPDATPPPIDADVTPDASPPPDAFVNSAPVIDALTTPLNVRAGATVAFTVTASDVDDGQTVTLSATGGIAEQNPLSAAAGGTFTPATGAFSMPAGILGTFDVRFTATDDFSTPASDNETVVINVAASDVVINEVQFLPTTSQAIELRNRGAAAVNTTGWVICINETGTGCYALPFTAIAAGNFKIIRWDQAGTDGDPEFFTGTTVTGLDTQGTIVLYRSATAVSNQVIDAVQFNVGGGAHEQIMDAVGAGQWPGADPGANGIDVGTYAPGNSLIYDGTGESAADWSITATPSFGGANP